MIALLIFFLKLLVLPSKPKPQLEAENAALRQQVVILQRNVRGRVRLTNSDRYSSFCFIAGSRRS